MTASIDQLRNALNGNTAGKPTVLQVQPVAPPERTAEEIGKMIGVGIILVPALLALLSLFLWLAAGAVHDLFPQVPAPSYWQSVCLVLGWHTVMLIARRPSWKWARR